jgi:hypothetical protein
MNEIFQTGPCADHEHDLVDLLEGSLGPERARAIRQHADSCPRCCAWLADFAALDERLADAMPRPALSADFERALQDRLATLVPPVTRGDLRAAVDRERERLIDAMRRDARRHVLLDGIGAAAVAASAIAAASDFIGTAGGFHRLLEGPQASLMLGGLGAALAVAAVAWSIGRGSVSIAGWGR